MAVPRFHVAAGLGPEAIGTEIALPDEVAHHAVRVTRLAAGDALVLFDGVGGEYAARLAAIDKRGARVCIDAFDPVERESPLAVTLHLAIIANDAMDFAVRKAVELGARTIVPVVTARSAPLPAGERTARRLAHWRQIAVAACEQCGRNRIPAIELPQPLAGARFAEGQPVYACTPAGGRTPAAHAPLPQACAVVVGPEGGLTDAELAGLLAGGAIPLALGPRILRAETAAVAALVLLQARWGDLR